MPCVPTISNKEHVLSHHFPCRAKFIVATCALALSKAWDGGFKGQHVLSINLCVMKAQACIAPDLTLPQDRSSHSIGRCHVPDILKNVAISETNLPGVSLQP